MTKNQVIIEWYVKRDTRYTKAFKPGAFVNGQSVYTTERAKKSVRGAKNAAMRIVENISRDYPPEYNEIVVKPKEWSL